MEYRKIITLLDNIPNQTSKFRTENWVEVNDDARGTNKTSKLKSSLCDYNDAYTLVSGTITVIRVETDAAETAAYRINKYPIFKNYDRLPTA